MFHGTHMFDRILTMNVPTLAIINGSAIAGGVFLGLCHDRMIMKDDPNFTMCLNELNFGMPICYGMANIPMYTLSKNTARHMLMGNKFTPHEALKEGVVRELYSDDSQVEAMIAKYAEEHAEKGNYRGVLKKSKTNFNMALHLCLNGPQ